MDKRDRKITTQQRIIDNQISEIDKLKNKIEELEIEEEQRDAIIKLADKVRDEMDEVIYELQEQRDQYVSLVKELKEMRAVMEEMVFGGNFKKVKRLLQAD